MRDGRRHSFNVKLAERPVHDEETGLDPLGNPTRERAPEPPPSVPLGLSVRELDRRFTGRLDIPESVQGVMVARVDPTGSAYAASIHRGFIIMEINRKPVRSIADYQRIVSAAAPGDVLAIYYYDPTLAQRFVTTVTVE